MRLIAVDPGLMSGLAYVDAFAEEGRLTPVAVELPAMDSVQRVILWSEGWAPGEVGIVCENYRQRPGAYSSQPDALHVIGALRFHCWCNGIPLTLRKPGEGNKFGTNAKLKKLGWYQIGMDAYRRGETSHPQALDAMRQLLHAAMIAGIVTGGELL
jgi:hypothetical protein